MKYYRVTDFQRVFKEKTGDFPFYKVGDISQAWISGSKYLTTANNYLPKKEAEAIKAHPLPKGATVFAKIGEAIKLNRRAILSKPSLVDNNVMGLHPRTNEVDPVYIFYFFNIIKLADYSRATTVPSVRKSDVSEITFPLAPPNEQKRIVAEIEKQFSRLDEAVAALKRIKANLKRYKASVLKAAVEGKLTEEWRTRRGELPFAHEKEETGADLLKRILTERRKKWEEEYIKKYVGAHGHAPKDDSWKKKYKEPQEPNTTYLPELSEKWKWVTLDQVSEINPSIDKKSIPDDLLVSFVPMPAVGAENGYINVNNTRPFSEVKKGFTNFLKGDVLFAKITPCMENGKMAIVPALSNGYGFGSTEFHVIRPYDGVNPYFIYYMVSNLSYRKEAAHYMTGAVGQKRVPASFLISTVMPLPPLEEQLQIIPEVQRRLSIIEGLYAEIEGNLKRAERLRQAILKKAFSGKLVPQDPNDESAKNLINRSNLSSKKAFK